MNEPSSRLSRRRFLAATAGMAGAGMLARPVWPTRPASGKKMGMALVGLGRYSTGQLAPALQETENTYLAGIVTGTPAKAKAWREKYDLPARNVYNYETMDRMADNPDINIVYIVLPNGMHAEYTTRALRAGKHVICEKPMAMSVRECESMIEAAEKAGRRLAVGYRMQYEATTQEVMRLGQERVYGPVLLVSSGGGFRADLTGHWKTDLALGGGPLYDMGVYPLQAARCVTGEEPVSVTAQSYTLRPSIFKEVPETVMFQLAFPSGARADLVTSHGISMNRLDVVAERGKFGLEPFQSYSGIRGYTSDGVLSYPQPNQQAVQMDAQAAAMRDGTPLRVSGEEGLRDLRVIEAVVEAARTGGKVAVVG